MDVAAIIKEIGRGKAGARDMDRATARGLLAAVLAGEVPPLQLGAVLMAMRIKGETVEELAGFLDAAHAAMARPAHALAWPIVIPSYNGARHTANLVALLAQLLVRRGAPVLVHGVSNDPKRVTTHAIFQAQGVEASNNLDDALRQMDARGVAFVAIEKVLPGLASVLALRWQMGVRSSAHTIVKMLQPLGAAAIQLVSVTHPEYLAGMRDYFAAYPAHVVLMRGTEGEAVASSKRPQAIEWLAGPAPRVLVPAEDGPILAVPDLPKTLDATVTARWIDEVLAGGRPVPPALARQVDALISLRDDLMAATSTPMAACGGL
jgi:anthranilate phosphoribosyltransferase